jgi:hypothetical protein
MSASVDAGFGRAYAVIVAYGLACATLYALAPADYVGWLPASRNFAAQSAYPAASAFAIDGMWVLLPLACVGFSLLAPVRLKPGHEADDPVLPLLPMVLIGLAATTLLAYFGLVAGALDPSPTTKLGRMNAGAGRNAIIFVLYWWGYFSILLFCVWLGVVAPWRAMRQMQRR